MSGKILSHVTSSRSRGDFEIMEAVVRKEGKEQLEEGGECAGGIWDVKKLTR